MSIRFSLVRINNAVARVIALLLFGSPVAAHTVAQSGHDLPAKSGTHRVVVRACAHERLFSNAHPLSPDGRWFLGHAAYEPDATRMVAEYGFVVYLPTGQRVLDRDLGAAFGAPASSGNERWLPERAATLRYTPASPHTASQLLTLDFPAAPPPVSLARRLCTRL